MKDLRPHYTTPAILAIVVLLALLGLGLWLMLDDPISANDTMITPAADDIVPADSEASPAVSPEAADSL